MNTTKICGLAVAFAAIMLTGLLQAQEVVALFTFRDLYSRNDGTTLPDKHLSVGMQPTLTMVEAGASLVESHGQGGLNQTFIDTQGICYSNNVSASWTSGLIGTENAGQNYFVLECSTLGICDLMLRFDSYATTATGPSELTLECALDEGEFQPLDTLTITRDSDWHAYTNNLAVPGAEHAERLRIRGTWSADTTYGSGRIDNLMLTGNFTNSLGRVAYYPFTVNRNDTAIVSDFEANAITAVSTGVVIYSKSNYFNDRTNTVSQAPCFGIIPQSPELNDNYYCFTVQPLNRATFKPTHLRGYFCAGKGTGYIEAAMVIGEDEISLGTETVTDTERPYTFVIPTNQTYATTLPMEVKIYFSTEGENSMRIDDIELLGFTGIYPVNTVVADFPFTGSVATDAANHPRINVSEITSHGAGTIGYSTSSHFGQSGVPALTVDGFDGDARNRYIAFDANHNSTTSLSPKLLSFYARTGSGSGFIQAEIIAGNQTFPLGAFWFNATPKMFCYSVKENLIPLNTQAMQIRFYAWGFASPITTLRIDDIKMEAVIGDLPSQGTIILMQ
jgi:hypothetical protein